LNTLLRHAFVRRLVELFRGLPRRVLLTWRYHGPKETLIRAALFPRGRRRAEPAARW
jgi:hypothetical protein